MERGEDERILYGRRRITADITKSTETEMQVAAANDISANVVDFFLDERAGR